MTTDAKRLALVTESRSIAIPDSELRFAGK